MKVVRTWTLPLVLGGMAVMLGGAGAKGEMSVAQFLAKADSLRDQGIMALGLPDIALLRDEARAASEAYRSSIDADRKAGRTAHSCPPPKGQAQIGSDDLIAHMRGYAPDRRPRTTVKTAIFDLMKKRYPCS